MIAVLALLGWLAWDKLATHLDKRFSPDRNKEEEKQETSPASSATTPTVPTLQPLQRDPDPAVKTLEAGLVSTVVTAPEPEPERWTVIRREMQFPVRPELLELVRALSRRDGQGVGSADLTGLYYDPARSLLIVKVPESRAVEVAGVLEASDIPPRQVTVEVALLLAQLGHGEEFGIEWLGSWSPGRADLGTGSVSIGGGSLSIEAGAFELALTSAVSSGRASVVARPSVGAEIGSKALIESGREVGVETTDSLNGNVVASIDFKKVSLSIETTVFLSGDMFQLVVKQRNDQLLNSASRDGSKIPEVSTQTLETSLMLRPGDWAAAGSVVVSRGQSAKGGFKLLPSSRSTRSTQREELGILVRIVDGLPRSVPVTAPFAVHPLPSATVLPVLVEKPVNPEANGVIPPRRVKRPAPWRK